jgi:hypothetical protein
VITLMVCSTTLQAVDVGSPMLACIPSMWFLSMLALTFATLFRSALSGFAVAGALWALDMKMGYAVHPFLSLQGLHALLDGDPLAGMWLIGKGTLLVAGALLLWTHGKLIRRVIRAPEQRDVIKMAGTVAAVLLVFVATGAATTVSYAYARRANLEQPDVVWLRRQLTNYGPVPVARMFGSAFATYVANPPEVREGGSATAVRVKQLEGVLQQSPHSIWADSIAFALGNEREQISPGAAASDYIAVADRFGNSPFAPKALGRVVRSESPEIKPEIRLTAARRLLTDYPQSREAEKAASLMEAMYPKTIGPQEMLRTALIAAQSGPDFQKPGWLLFAARIQSDQGQKDAAIATARKARETGHDLQRRATQPNQPLYVHRFQIDGAVDGATELLKKLGAS